MIKIGTIIMIIGFVMFMLPIWGFSELAIFDYLNLIHVLIVGGVLFIMGLITHVYKKVISKESWGTTSDNWIMLGMIAAGMTIFIFWRLYNMWN